MKPKATLKARALRYLSIREYSPKELARKLSPYVEEGDDLAALMEWLQKQGFLSEERFAEAFVRRRCSRYGSGRVLRELEMHGVDEKTLDEAKSVMSENEFDRALGIWRKKFGSKPVDASEKAKQIRFLTQRGFSGDIVRRVLNWEEHE